MTHFAKSARAITLALALVALALLGLTPPARAQFAGQSTWAGSCGGTANAQTLTLPNVHALSDLLGVQIGCVPTNANTSSTTLAVSGLTATTVKRPSVSGLIALIGGEITPAFASYVYDGTEFVLTSPVVIPPQTTVYTTGSGTYTPPAGAVAIDIQMCGAGSGGGGGGWNSGSSTAGGATTFGTSLLTANGGASSNVATSSSWPSPATASGGSPNLPGALGAYSVQNAAGGGNIVAGTGAPSPLFGGGAPGGTFTSNPAPPSSSAFGAGGGGGAMTANPTNSGAGGNSGACLLATLTAPLSGSYSYSVGAGGAGGPGSGSNGSANGSSGGGGVIIAKARFQ